MNITTYTPEQMKLSAQFADAWNRAQPDKKAVFETIMSAVIFGMEIAEQNAVQSQERPTEERPRT